jgi:hypothetical protein
MQTPSDIITAPVKEFSRLSGLGESTVWVMLNDGRLESIAVGRRRLVLVDSYRRLIDEQLSAPPQDARRNGAVPALGSKRPGPPGTEPEPTSKRGRGRPRKLRPSESVA